MIEFDFNSLFKQEPPEPETTGFQGFHDMLRQLRSADAALATIQDAVIQTDSEDGIVRANRAAEVMAGVDLNGLVGSQLEHALPLTEPVWERRTVRLDRPRPEGVFRVLRLKGGEERLVLVSLSKHAHGKVYVLRDMSGNQGNGTGLDGLTGLPDRRSLESHVASLFTSDIHQGWFLVYLDLDQFKVVNDLCGHRAGDSLLQQLTRCWLATVGSDEILARLGGDEFCAVIKRDTVEDATLVAERLIDEADRLRFEWSGQVFRIGASAGLVDLGTVSDADAALAAADSACWAAKENGRNRLHVFDSGDRDLRNRQEQMGWISRVAHAIDEDHLELHYQHITPIAAESNTGHAEILVRLRGEDGILVQPDRFIPAAERYNQMPRLDRWVVSRVCEGLAHRLARYPTVALGSWAINISGTTFSDPKFTDWVKEQILGRGIPPDSIGFELTETAAISDVARARRFIAAMRDIGCTISLDDFGSGVSSFAYLKTLTVDYLKIDGTFVRNMLIDHVDRAMVEAIHRVGTVMGIPTIAEFVEEPVLMDTLRAIGIGYGQGYGIHKPQPWPWGSVTGVDLPTR